MVKSEELGLLDPEEYGSRTTKAVYIQDFNTRIFYDLIRLNIFLAKNTFADLISNYYLVVHTIAYLSLQTSNVPKNPIKCTFTALQDMEHSVCITFSDSE